MFVSDTIKHYGHCRKYVYCILVALDEINTQYSCVCAVNMSLGTSGCACLA